MKATHKILTTLDLGILGERECEVEFSYSPGRPAVMYLRNGDPGYPEDPPEIDIEDITILGASITGSIADALIESDGFLSEVAEMMEEA